MPSTLVHMGVQGIVSKAVFRAPDFKWVFLGLLLPDAPWIGQRVVRALPFRFDACDLALYNLAQTSFAFCLLLSAALALLTLHPWRTWCLLGLNALLHMLLDAMECKGGNGVYLLAPFSWRMTDFNLLRPEGPLMIALTVFGLAYALARYRAAASAPSGFAPPSARRFVAAAGLVALYLLLPAALLDGPRKANAFSIATLLDVDGRAGKPAAFDRAIYRPGPEGRLRLFTGEELEVEGLELDRRRLVTVEGHFISPRRFRVDRAIVHTPRFRSLSTLVGLALGAAMWLHALAGPLAARRNKQA